MMAPARYRPRMLRFLALLLLTATPALAQSRPGGGWGAGGGRRHRGMMGGPRGERARIPSAEDIDGPPAPAALQQIAGLTDEQASRYAGSYDAHMTATRPARDSLRAGLKAARAAFVDGDRAAARASAPEITRLWKDLSKQDEKFEKELGKMLDKEQRKRYEQWRDDQRKAADERRRERMPYPRNRAASMP